MVRGCPKGLGSPVFDKLEAELAKAIMSLPATKGFEIGSGFEGSRMLGSEHNDEFYMAEDGQVRTRTNRSGGVQGGLSNGEHIVIRIAFKPTSTIAQRQQTVNRAGQEVELIARGRHDPCVVPRAVPMVEAMVALVLADQLLQVRLVLHVIHWWGIIHGCHSVIITLTMKYNRACHHHCPSTQHYAQCELLPRSDASGPDAKVPQQFRQVASGVH